MYPHFIEVNSGPEKVSVNLDRVTGFREGEILLEGSMRIMINESYDEVQQLIFDAGYHIAKKDPRLEDKPLTMEDIRRLLGEPVWNSNRRSWALVKGVREDSVTLVYWLADWELADAEYLAKYPLYRMRAAACR